MVDPVSSTPLGPINPVRPPGTDLRPQPGGGDGFAALLRRQIEEVNRMQAEADAGVQSLLTGESDNITAVLATTRKAEVAFSLLMEIRNKLVDAYSELKQLRV
ncbi:MAG: flagellar hook-basal body complex protein FliE [Planctomycetota bacterium]